MVDDAIAIAQHAGVSVPAVLITDADDGDGDTDGSAEHCAEQRTEQHAEQYAERLGPADVLWRDVVPRQAATRECVWVGSEHPLFVLHTSGSTGAPKGVVHTTGGYMVYVATAFRYVFDHRDGDVCACRPQQTFHFFLFSFRNELLTNLRCMAAVWATGDCGWIMVRGAPLPAVVVSAHWLNPNCVLTVPSFPPSPLPVGPQHGGVRPHVVLRHAGAVRRLRGLLP